LPSPGTGRQRLARVASAARRLRRRARLDAYAGEASRTRIPRARFAAVPRELGDQAMKTQSFLSGRTALVSLGASVPGVFARGVAAAANEGSARNKTLVIVQLAGGIDGLNTIVPYKDGAYRDVRPQLALPDDQLIPVNDRVAFHPALGKIKDLFDS